MAIEERVELVSANAGVDLSASTNQFKVVKLDANGNVIPVAAITDTPFGILYDTAISGAAVPVATGGICKATAGGTIAAGAPIACTATGTVQTAVATQFVLGTARIAAVAGDVFPINVETSSPWIHA